MVNGDPARGKETQSGIYNLARYQFSFELRDLLLLRLAGLAAFSVLLTLVILIVTKSNHVLCKLLIASTAFDTFGVFASTISTLAFAVDGEGAPSLMVFGDLLYSTGQSCLVLIFMFLVRGWTVSTRVLRRPGACILIWMVYVLLNLICTGWLHASAISLRVLSAGTLAPEWSTSPGLSIIALRTCALGFFVIQLRETVQEAATTPLQLYFYHHFAAATLVWFVSWPIVVAVAATFISPLDRQRTLAAFAIVIDVVAISIMLRVFKKSIYKKPGKHPILQLGRAPSTGTSGPGGSSQKLQQAQDLLYSAWVQLQSLLFSLWDYLRDLTETARAR